MKRRLNLRTTCQCADGPLWTGFLGGGVDPPLDLNQVFRNQLQVGQRRIRDWLLLLLPGDFE